MAKASRGLISSMHAIDFSQASQEYCPMRKKLTIEYYHDVQE